MPQIPVTWNGLDSHGNPLTWGSPEFVWNGTISTPTPKKMPQLRVLLGFSNAPDHSLEETAEAVIAGLYGNAAFPDPPSPPVTKVQLQAALANFRAAIAAQAQGGPAATAHKNDMREALIALLRKLAGYVQQYGDNNLANILSTGFEVVSTNRAQSPLDAPTIKDIRNGNTRQLIVSVTPVPNAKTYEGRYALAPAGGMQGPWLSAGLFTNSRAMVVDELTPGANYVFQFRAIGGSTGYSDWSDPVGHMSM
jgi:hypothetical protein